MGTDWIDHKTEGNAKSLWKDPQDFHRKQSPSTENELKTISENAIFCSFIQQLLMYIKCLSSVF